MKFLKDAQKNVRAVGCTDCKCSSFCYINYNISEEENYRFVKEVGKWAMEHPRKTYAQDFLRSFRKQSRIKKCAEDVPRQLLRWKAASTPLFPERVGHRKRLLEREWRQRTMNKKKSQNPDVTFFNCDHRRGNYCCFSVRRMALVKTLVTTAR